MLHKHEAGLIFRIRMGITQARKLQAIIFSEMCCPNTTRAEIMVNCWPACQRLGGRRLAEIAPSVARVALIYNPQSHAGQYFDSIEAAARSLAIKLIRVAFREAGDTERGIEAFARQPNGGRLVCQTRAPVCIASRS
jgi:hypothetical protein